MFIKYLDEPIEVDPTGCKTVSAFIEKTQKKFSPHLDSFPLDKLTLHRHTGTKLRPGLKISELLNQSGFENSDLTPLLIRCAADNLLSAGKKTKTSRQSEERRKNSIPFLLMLQRRVERRISGRVLHIHH
jgi:hypothetical protein